MMTGLPGCVQASGAFMSRLMACPNTKSRCAVRSNLLDRNGKSNFAIRRS